MLSALLLYRNLHYSHHSLQVDFALGQEPRCTELATVANNVTKAHK